MIRMAYFLFIITLMAPVLAYATPETTPKPAFSVTIPYGLLVVEVEKDGRWQEVKRLGFTHVYKEQSLDLSSFVVKGKEAKVRLRRDGGGKHSHLDVISLGGSAPVALDNGKKGDLGYALKKDNDVLPLAPITTFTFPAKRDGDILSLLARVEPKIIPTMPFLYPPENKGKDLTAATTFYEYTVGDVKGSLNLSGDATQVDGAKLFINVHSTPGSGHPEGPTVVWVRDDGKKLYIALEFTSDNTVDGPVDYAKVYAVGPKGSKEYKITEVDTKWGAVGFTGSKRAAYRHKFYEFAIPLSDVGATRGDNLQLAFAAYGTSSIGPPVDGDTFPLGSVNVGASGTTQVSFTFGSGGTWTSTFGGADPTMFTVGTGTCGGTFPLAIGNTTCNLEFTFTPSSAGLKSATWTINDVPLTTYTYNLTGTGVATADITINGRGKVTSTDGQVSCTASCTPAVTGTVTLYASPASGFYFNNWTGDCTGNRTCDVAAGGSVTANFRKESADANNPPASGTGSDWLSYPSDGQSGVPTETVLKWTELTDADGDPIAYTLYICHAADWDADANDCVNWIQITTVTASNEGDDARLIMTAKATATGAAALFAIGLIGALRSRGGRATMMALMMIASAGVISSCATDSDDSSDSATTYTVCSDEAGALCEDISAVYSLDANTEYHWYVNAADGNGGSTNSGVRSFTTGDN